MIMACDTRSMWNHLAFTAASLLRHAAALAYNLRWEGISVDSLLEFLTSFKVGIILMIRLGDMNIDYSQLFLSHLTTKLPNPIYATIRWVQTYEKNSFQIFMEVEMIIAEDLMNLSGLALLTELLGCYKFLFGGKLAMLAVSKMYEDLITLPGDSEEGDDESEFQRFWFGAIFP